MKKSVLALATLLMTHSALACMGAAIALNDDVTLTGEAVVSKVSGVLDLNTLTKKKWIGVNMDVEDSSHVTTHNVVVLGGTQDSGGIISMSYLLKDAKTGQEKVYLLKSNYQGGGMRARGLSTPAEQGTQDPDFNSLIQAGC
jgi:hypothetical protein